MALPNGTKLGPYEIVAPLGAGGMGEVYRARDTRLGRDVAIKILPSQLSERPESRQRFEREARAVSALNHPHICTLHDVGSQDGTEFLVMEYLEGETLAAGLEKGPLPLDQVLKYGVEIADALNKAHRQAIIHRDLKPGNIMLTKSGAKLLDFGLAKAVDSPQLSDLTLSLTSPAASKPVTATGTVIGTFQYMSPEQIEGKEADTRSDIFAFGTVLYEMATGMRAFEGKSQASVVAAILAAEPKPISVLRPMSPPALDRVVKVCMAKDPDERWQTAHDVKLQLQWIAEGGSQAGVPAPVVSQRKRQERAAWATAALFVLTTVAFAAGFLLRAPKPQQPVRLSAELGADVRLGVPLAGSEVVLSPDGTRLVLLAVGADNEARLYIRSLDQLRATPLSGTEGARNPFFSPDGQWIGFFSTRDNSMKKISVQGGAAVTLCKTSNTYGGSWGEDGTILFAHVADPSGLFKVSAAGGALQPVLRDKTVTRDRHLFPQILPGGKAVLFTSGVAANPEEAEIVVYSMASGESKTVFRGGFYARYLASGHLVYMHRGTMFAAPFNLDHLEVTGQAVPVVEGVVTSPMFGGAQYSVSDTGTLVYVAGMGPAEGLLLHWFDQQGKAAPLHGFPPGIPANPRISPDGRRLAVDIDDGKRRDVFVYDLERDTPTRITFLGERNSSPVWTPDGRQITYASQDKDGSYGLYLIRADGAGDAQRLTQSKVELLAGSWRPDGKVLAYVQTNPETGSDIMTLTLEGSEQSGWKVGEPQPFLNTPANESAPQFSPDGRWLAYQSDESGAPEVYVRPFPGTGGKWQISPDIGLAPRWARNGKELLYRTAGQRIMIATYAASGETFHADKTRSWASGQLPGGPPSSWDLEPDGKRIAAVGVAANDPAQALNKVSFIFNFFDELRRKVPAGKN